MTITAELHDGRTLEFPDGTDPAVVQKTVKRLLSVQQQEPAFEREARQIIETTPAELIAGHPVTRFALGAASPVLGAAQLAAETVGDKPAAEQFKKLEKMKQAGMRAYGSEGTDVIGLGGAVLGPGSLAAMKVAPAATGLGRAGQGAAIGAGFGAVSPVADEDYWSSKGGQVLLGTVIGGAVPAAIDAAKTAGGVGRSLIDMTTEGGAKRILSRYQRKIIGEEQVPSVIQAARSAPEFVPGSKPTAAEALATTPAGSPIVAHQNITAATPGGISAQFGQRKLDQQAAIEAAEKARDIATAPMRDAALDQANQMGGIKADPLIQKIDAIAAKPGLRASDVVTKSMASIKEKLESLVETGRRIDAEDLYTVRKEVGNTIASHAKETANWDKRLSGRLESDVQKLIDDAIENAGGLGWKAYLKEYSKRSQAIEADNLRRLAKPEQATNLGGGVNVAEETRLKLPQMLDRTMMATNFVLKKLGSGIERRIDPEAARRYLDPKALADELAKMPPAWRSRVVGQLIQLGRVPPIVGAQEVGQQ